MTHCVPSYYPSKSGAKRRKMFLLKQSLPVNRTILLKVSPLRMIRIFLLSYDPPPPPQLILHDVKFFFTFFSFFSKLAMQNLSGK